MGTTLRKMLIAGAASVAGGMLLTGALVPLNTPVAQAASLGGQLPKLVTLPGASTAETQMLDLLNRFRLENGLTQLVRVPTLDKAALDWSTYMAEGGCLERSGTSLCHRRDLALVASMASPKGWTRAGENVGSVPDGGTLQSLHDAFANSPAHRANMLNAQFNAVGVGVNYNVDGKLFITFEFITTVGVPNSTGPVVGFPEAPEGLAQEDAFLFYVNFLREQAGLQPLVRQAVLDREAAWWSDQRKNGACGPDSLICNRKDSSAMVKASVGAGKTRWWAGAAGVTVATDVSAQVAWFASSTPLRNMLLRKNANLIGIGYAKDADGNYFISLTVLQARNPVQTLPKSATTTCGWVETTLKVRAKGVGVRVAQCALAAEGLWPGAIDGKYTTDMVTAVKTFQRAHNLRANGTLDLKTRRALHIN